MCPFTMIAWLLCVTPIEEPPHHARLRFPPQEICVSAYQFNLRFQSHCQLEINRAMSPREAEHWYAALRETQLIARAWLCITLFPHEKEMPEMWRVWIPNRRDALGDEAFFAGAMPPPAPIQYFRFTD